MKEEIIGGLKNALDRGESIEKAVKSFVSAGYNPAEVRAAADMVSRGATSVIATKPFPAPVKGTELPPLPKVPEKQAKPLPKIPKLPGMPSKEPKKKRSKLRIAIIVVIGLILLVIIGFLITMFL